MPPLESDSTQKESRSESSRETQISLFEAARRRLSEEAFREPAGRLSDSFKQGERAGLSNMETTETTVGELHIRSTGGRIANIARGNDSYDLEYDSQGRISKITENINGSTTTLTSLKDFQPGAATISKDGELTIKSADGKLSVTRTKDFSRIDKLIGDKPDGSADQILSIHTRAGTTRDFIYDKDNPKELIGIRDTLPTNNGRPLVEETTRIGHSNIWEFKTNYGVSAQRTNVQMQPNGDFAFSEIKRPSAPSDIIHTDDSDWMHADLVAARKAFCDLAESHSVFKGSTSTIESWERKFEQRCRDLAHEGRKAPTDEQIVRTYGYLGKILQGHENGIGSRDRRWMVEAALREYAEPNKYTNQGSHPSCGDNAVERHVVQVYPDEHARVLWEALTYKSITSKFRDEHTGRRKVVRLNDTQIKPDGEAAAIAKGSSNLNMWSYSNKVFQIAAISMSYPGYRGNGHGFSGTTEDQARFVNKFVTGEKKLPIVNRWYGGKPSFESLQSALKKGTVGYIVPGHFMTIDKAKVQNGVPYVHVDNSWGGMGDGWKTWSRV